MPKTITVAQGDCFASIAEDHHFFDWRHIYDDPANEKLRLARPNPNDLLPGDQVVIPDKPQRVETRNTGSKHQFVVQRLPTMLRIRLEGLEPVLYRLEVGELVFEGQGSMVEHRIPPNASSGTLHIWLDPEQEEPSISWQLLLGHIDPALAATGLKDRLDNLGFPTSAGPDLDDATRVAVRAFQQSKGIAASEEIDEAVHEQVRLAHDVG